MHMTTPDSRITLSPDVTRQVFDPGSDGELLRLWLRYLKGLIREDGFDLEDVVAPDVRCIDLELAGFPAGIAGLRPFRDRIALLVPDARLHVLHAVTHVAQSTVEAVIRYIRAPEDQMGATTSWEVKTLARFDDGRMIERWDRSDMPRILSQLHIAT